MNKIALAALTTVLASPALANINVPNQPMTSVPEISALEGTAALAVIAAFVLIAWERRRRAV